ncbi:MAG: hypothetical protein KBD63_06760 [Bacteriovoracaceae bacterium]|nr:hypothetical protein [Bacteriovoracaceae bacterium]
MSIKLLCSFLMLCLTSVVCAENYDFSKQNIWEITGRKRAVYQQKGIFHSTGFVKKSTLSKVRGSFNNKEQTQRIVFELTTNRIPKIYGYKASEDQKIFLDFFATDLKQELAFSGKYIEKIITYDLSKEMLSLEIILKGKRQFDAFFLDNPARFVIDIK